MPTDTEMLERLRREYRLPTDVTERLIAEIRRLWAEIERWKAETGWDTPEEVGIGLGRVLGGGIPNGIAKSILGCAWSDLKAAEKTIASLRELCGRAGGHPWQLSSIADAKMRSKLDRASEGKV